MNAVFRVAGLSIKEIFRKKDFYVALILTGVILFYASRLQFYRAENAFRYLLDIGISLSVIFSVILTVALAARQFPSEMQNRTCHVLLSKPVRRAEFVGGKFLGSFLAGSACFAVFFGVVAFFACLKNPELPWQTAVQTFYLFCLGLMLLAALATFFSFVLTTSANVSVTLLIYLMISLYGYGLKKFAQTSLPLSRMLNEAVYYAVPHFEFFDMRQRFIHGWDPLSAKLVLFLTAYAVVYAALFLGGGWLIFRKKPIL